MKWINAVACVLLTTAPVAAQFTTVQLPTFQTFSIGTTVSVPDRGSAYLGGINRSYRHSIRRGAPLLPRAHRAFGGGTSSSNAWVSAHVHDLEALDEATLGRWNQLKSSRAHAVGIARPMAPTVSARQPRVSDVRRAVAQRKQATLARAKRDYELGMKLESKGNLTGAKNSYRNALKRADDALKKQVSTRLAKVTATLAQSTAPTQRR